MSSLNLPESLVQPLSKPLMRAQEIETTNPLVSYFVRMDCLNTAMKIYNSVEGEEQLQVGNFLNSLMKQLEEVKKSLGEGGIPNDETGKKMVTRFGLRIFNRAQVVDLANKANKSTAMTYLAANTFLSTLGQFGAIDPQVLARSKFAKARGVVILRSIKTNTPIPPLPNSKSSNDTSKNSQNHQSTDSSSEDQVSSDSQDISTIDNDLDSLANQLNNLVVTGGNNTPTTPSAPSGPTGTIDPPPQIIAKILKNTNTTNNDYKPPPGSRFYISEADEKNFYQDAESAPPPVPVLILQETTKLFRQALSAVQFEDPECAIEKAQKAIDLLKKNMRNRSTSTATTSM